MHGIIDDFRFAFRALSARPGFVLAAVLTLALGIGANTAIFSVINAFLLKPLPYPDGERLVDVYNSYPTGGLDRASVSIPDYLDRREHAEALEDLALYTWEAFNLAASGTPERYVGLVATPSLFSTLRVSPALGRAFTEDDAVPGNDRVAIINHDLWRNRFNADPDIVGDDVRLNGESFRIVGVMPEGFAFPNRDIALYVPFAFTSEQMLDESRGYEFSTSIGRLAPGATIEQANAQFDAIVRSNIDRFVAASERGAGYAEFLKNSGFTGRAQSFRESLVGDLRTALLVLQGVVVFVLLIACANVANLMLARVLGRAREMAMRCAVGANRMRVGRQLVIEGVLLGLGGGALGVLLSVVVIRLVALFGIDRSAQHFDIAIDPVVLAFAFGMSVFAGVVFSVVSVIAALRMNVQHVIKEGGRGQTANRVALMVRSVLVSFQVALAAALLIGAGLMLRSFQQLQQESPGFDPHGVVSVRLELSGRKYAETETRRQFFDRVLESIRAIPGVDAAGYVSVLPFSNKRSQATYRIDGYTPAPGENNPHGHSRYVDEDYFRAMGIPLLQGRGFDTALDTADGPWAAVIDELLAKKYFADRSPIGQRIANRTDESGAPIWATVIGVVGTIKNNRLTENPDKETYYHFYRQRTPDNGAIVIATALPPQFVQNQVRGAVLSADPEQPVYDIRSMDERLTLSLGDYRAPTLLVSIFAGTAILLAVVGIHGVLSYVVGQRTAELGVRMALGAQASSLMTLVLGQGAWLVGTGLVIGVFAALALTRFLASMLFGISMFDPLTYTAVPALLLAVGMAACFLPAWRATRISPIAALRYE